MAHAGHGRSSTSTTINKGAIIRGFGGSVIVCGIYGMYVVMASCKRGCHLNRDAVPFVIGSFYGGVGLMNGTLDMILVNRCNQSDKFRTVLPAKMYVCVLGVMVLAAAAVLVVGAGVGVGAEWDA